MAGLGRGSISRNSEYANAINMIWRRGWDSNPRYGYPYNGFRDRPISDTHGWQGEFSVVAGPGFGPIFGILVRSGIVFGIGGFEPSRHLHGTGFLWHLADTTLAYPVVRLWGWTGRHWSNLLRRLLTQSGPAALAPKGLEQPDEAALDGVVGEVGGELARIGDAERRGRGEIELRVSNLESREESGAQF